MALSPEYKAKIVAALPAKYREAYSSGQIDDNLLQAFADRAGILPPKAVAPSKQSAPAPTPHKDEEPSGLQSFVSNLLFPGYEGSDANKALREIGTSARAGLNRTLGSIEYSAADGSTDKNPAYNAGFAVGGLAPAPYRAPSPVDPEAKKRAIDRANSRLDRAQELQQRADDLNAQIKSPTVRNVAMPVADVAGSPSSLASIPGGPFAAIPSADTFYQEYAAARRAGLSDDEARKRASAMAAVEGSISAIPTGRLFRVGAKRPIETAARRYVGGVLGTGVKEGISEGATQLAQEGVNTAFTGSEDQTASEYAKARKSLDLWSDTWRATMAGFAGGAGIHAAHSPFEIAAENGKRATDMAMGDQANGMRLRTEAKQQEESAAQAAKKQAEIDAAYKARDTAPAPDQQRIADEQEAGFRTMEIRRKAEERLRATPGDPIASKMMEYTVTPEMVAKERAKDADITRQIADEQARIQREEKLTPYKKAAADDIKKSLEEDLKKAQAKHQAAKRKASAEFIASAKTMPENERADFLATKRLEWDEANPKPTAESIRPKIAAPAAPQVAPTVSPTAAPAPQTSTPGGMTEQDIRSFGLSSSGEKATSAKSADVLAAISSKIGTSREHAALGKLIADGKLVLVDTASQIPGYTPDMKGNAGYYDGKKMYVTADTIDPNNIKGSMLVVAAHEAKHAADVSGAGKTGVASIANFIGTDANARINKKIMQEAAEGSPAAEFAAKQVEGMNADEASLELPAYYVTAAMQRRKSGAALGDIVSAVRTKYKSLTGQDVDLKDIGYMANKLVQNLAVSNESIRGDVTKPLAMVVGPDHADFAQRKADGKTYVDFDGKEKTLLSDADATFDPAAFSKIVKTGRLPLKSFMTIPALKGYDKYDLGNIRVNIDGLIKKNSAYFDPTGDVPVIHLSDSFLDHAVSDPATVKDILLHEVQHYVQRVEDFARGGQPDEFYTTYDKSVIAKQKEAGKNVLRFINEVFNSGGDIEGWDVDRENKARVNEVVYNYKDGLLTSVEASQAIKQIADGTTSDDLKHNADEFIKSAAANAQLNGVVRKIADKRYQNYLDLLGEREARFTAENKHKSQKALDELLKPRYYGTILVPDNNVDGRIVAEYNVPAPKGLSSKASGMTTDVMDEAKVLLTGSKARFVVDNTKGQFSAFGVLGRALGNIKELAEGEAASIAYVAEGDYYRTKFGIAAMAKRRGIPLSRANAEVDAVLSEAGKIEDITRREAHIGRYVAANPELRPLAEALDNIAKQSKAIVAARARDPRPMTEEEIRKYSAIIKNRYAYFTTTYAAFQGKEGRARNEALKKEAMIANKRRASGVPVPAKYKSAQRTYNRAVDFIAANDVAVFDPEQLVQQDASRIDYLYSLWVGDPEALREQIRNDRSIRGNAARQKAFRAAAEIAIANAGKTVNPDAVLREARYIVDGMLGLNEQSNPVISYYRGAKEDRSILETRTKLPEQIAELYGEVKDIPTRVAITLAKQGELAARMRMLNTVYEAGKGKWFIDKAEYKNSPENEKFSEELNGEEWGPLNGARVTPAIAAGLNDGLDIFTPLSTALAQGHATIDRAAEASTHIAMRGLRKASAVQKFIQIVLSPFNTAVNFLGSGTVIAQNGGARPDDMLRALKASATLLNNQIAPQGIQGKLQPMVTNPDLELFLKYTLLDSAVGQELRSMPTKFLKQLVTELDTASTFAEANKIVHKAMSASGNAKGFVTEAFALSDAWVKPAIFLSRVRFLNNINNAEGNGWTQEQIEKMAADMTKDTTITFQRAAPIVKLTERLPLTWYATYMQGVFRSVMYSYHQATKDILASTRAKTPEGQMLYALEGAKRLAGATSATVGFAFATKVIASMLNDDKDDKYLDGARKMLFTEGRYGDGIYLGKTEDGLPAFMRLSRIDPNGPVNDMLRIAMSDEDPAAKERALIEHIKGLWITPRTTADVSKLIMSIFSDDPVKNKSTKIERLLPKTTTMFKEALPADYGTAESFMQFLDGFVPGAANAFDQEAGTPTNDQDFAKKAIAWMTILTGGRLDVADPDRAAFGAGNKLNTLQKEGRARVSEALENFGPQAAIDKFADVQQEEETAFAQLRDVYDGMLMMGYSPAAAQKVLKDNKVQAQDIAIIRQGRTPDGATGLINEDSLNKLGAMRDQRLAPDERKQSEEQRKAALAKLRLLLKKREE